jgi:hypothetical protein
MNARQKAELVKACEKRIARVQHQLSAPIKVRQRMLNNQEYLAEQIRQRESLLAIPAEEEDRLPLSIPPYLSWMWVSLR